MESKILQDLNKAADAGIPVVRTDLPLRMYLRSAHEMHRQARSYLAEDDILRAYILFLRYVTLVVRELPRHPQYKDESKTNEFFTIKQDCNETIARLESLRPMVLALAGKSSATSETSSQSPHHAIELQNRPRAISDSLVHSSNHSVSSTSTNTNNTTAGVSSSSDGSPLSHEERQQILAALGDEDWTVAQELAGLSLQQRSTSLKSNHGRANDNKTILHNLSYPVLNSHNQSSRVYPPRASSAHHAPPLPPLFDHRITMPAPPRTSSSRFPGTVSIPSPTTHVSPFLPPVIPADQGPPPVFQLPNNVAPPQVPPRFHFPSPSSSSIYPGHIPSSSSSLMPSAMEAHAAAPYPKNTNLSITSLSNQQSPPKPKPIIREEPIRAVNEAGEPLRTLYLPQGIIKGFMQVAHINTMHNVETCGILCGILSRNAFRVTTLIIPKQSATSDTCQTEDEGSLFAELDKRDLMTLGWIHTHPTQTCFMSSVDLHTHFSYQIMLPEAVAVVCAPRHNPLYQVFRLTKPPGMDIIQNCRQKGAFHPHIKQPLYTDITRDGHVFFYAGDYETIDIRNK